MSMTTRIGLLAVAMSAACWLTPLELCAQEAPPPAKPAAVQEPEKESPGDARGGRHWRRPGERWGRGEEIRALMEKLKQDDPKEYERLEALSRSDRMAYYKEIGKLLPHRPMRKSKLGILEQKCRDLGKQYREAVGEEEKAKLKAELTTAVKESFDEMLADSKRRLEVLQERLAAMEEKEDEILAQRLEYFLSGNSRLFGPGRDDTPPPPPAPSE
ncbi:MAG: hypothetical protein GX945_16210 [Lentisphaerae bacterium]|nr:hypothetical protein [Lentisphaerota bacterium]